MTTTTTETMTADLTRTNFANVDLAGVDMRGAKGQRRARAQAVPRA